MTEELKTALNNIREALRRALLNETERDQVLKDYELIKKALSK